MASDYKWKPIEDLPADWPSLTDSELSAIRQVYADLKALDPAATAVWEEQSRREWAIETGRIEDVYRWDRGTTETLMAKGIFADLIPRKGNDLEPEQIAAIIQNQREVLDGLFDFVKGERQLSKSYIHELHQALLKNIPTYKVTDEKGIVTDQALEKGVYKKWPNSVRTTDGGRHEYCPPEHVESEMDRLIEWHRRHMMEGVAPEVEGAWLHHRFTQIHPYPDGNGRVARALASLVLIKERLFPLVVRTEKRLEYWDALRAVDLGDLSRLIEFIRQQHGQALVEFSQVVEPKGPDADQVTSVDAAIKALRLDLISRGQLEPRDWSKAISNSAALHRYCCGRLNTLGSQLTEALGQHFSTTEERIIVPDRAPSDRVNYTAGFLFADAGFPKILFFAATAGEKYRGVATYLATYCKSASDFTAIAQPFLVTYAESQDVQIDRFSKWVESAILNGLQRWRASLKA